MKKFLVLLTLISVFFSCGEHEFEPLTVQGVQFAQTRYDFPVFQEQTITTSSNIRVAVTTLSSQDRTFNVSVGLKTTASSSQFNLVSSQIIVPANSYFGEVVLTSSYSSLTDNPVFVELVLDDDSPKVLGRETTLVKLFKGCSQNLVNLNFSFDGYASEITWEIKNSSNVTVDSGGGYSDGQPSATEQICLAAGNYTLIVYDSYGDGLSFPGNGSFNLNLNGTVLASGGGNFGFQISVPFIVP